MKISETIVSAIRDQIKEDRAAVEQIARRLRDTQSMLNDLLADQDSVMHRDVCEYKDNIQLHTFRGVMINVYGIDLMASGHYLYDEVEEERFGVEIDTLRLFGRELCPSKEIYDEIERIIIEEGL